MHPSPEHEVTRRRLLAAIGSGTAVTIAGCNAPTADTSTPTSSGAPPDSPAGRVAQLDKYPRVEVGSVDELAGGDVSTFAYPLNGQRNFLTRLSESAWGGAGPDDSIVAYSTVCTHMGCSVGSNVDPGRATAGPCPCHYTSFDLSKGGLTVTGPATTDLPQIELEVENGTVYATGVDGLMFGYRNNLRDGEPVVGTENGETATPSTPTPESGGGPEFDGWFGNVDNYDGTVADQTGQDEVTVDVGAEGNGGAFAFAPAAVRISTGTTVVWEWTGEGGQHNVVAEEGGDFESELTDEAGFTFEHTFESAGTVTYYCVPHRSLGMKGAIVVE